MAQGGTTITVGEYAIALREEARRQFYHGRPSEAELAKFQREVADKLIERELILQEAARHGMRVDSKAVDAELARQRERTRKAAREKQPDEKFWRALRKRLEQEQLVAQFPVADAGPHLHQFVIVQGAFELRHETGAQASLSDQHDGVAIVAESAQVLALGVGEGHG